MRKKVIGIILTCILSLSIGITFALSDSGLKLLDWYQDQSKKQEQKISNSTMQKLIASLQKLQEQIPSTQQGISKAITDFQNTTLLESKTSINEHNKNYLHQLHTVTEEIKKQNAEEMAAYTKQKKQQETEEITQDVQAMLEDLLNNN